MCPLTLLHPTIDSRETAQIIYHATILGGTLLGMIIGGWAALTVVVAHLMTRQLKQVVHVLGAMLFWYGLVGYYVGAFLILNSMTTQIDVHAALYDRDMCTIEHATIVRYHEPHLLARIRAPRCQLRMRLHCPLHNSSSTHTSLLDYGTPSADQYLDAPSIGCFSGRTVPCWTPRLLDVPQLRDPSDTAELAMTTAVLAVLPFVGIAVAIPAHISLLAVWARRDTGWQ